jgi:ketosteroid isomerase-like protein
MIATQEDIKACEKKLLRAMQDCDLQVLDELLHDDLLFNGPTSETITKEMDLAAYKSRNMVADELIASVQQISVIGDTGIVAVTVEVKGSFMQQPIQGKFRYIRTWKNIDGKWKMIGGGCTPIQ